MRHIQIQDRTLCTPETSYSFKDKLEIARLLARAGVDTIELPSIEDPKADGLLVRTVAAFAKDCRLSVAVGLTEDGVGAAAASLATAAKPVLRVELPLSTVGMEYVCHKKAPQMAEYAAGLVAAAKATGIEVEFCALDATRANQELLRQVLVRAAEAGANSVALFDSAAALLPDAFAAFAASFTDLGLPLSVSCSDQTSLAAAEAVLAVNAGAVSVKTSAAGGMTSLAAFAGILRDRGNDWDLTSGLCYTEMERIAGQIAWIIGGKTTERPTILTEEDARLHLDQNDDAAAVTAAAEGLGYDLSEEDARQVYEEFRRVAAKKKVGARELEAIVASAAGQVPPTYTLVNFAVNTGNVMAASAQITLQKGGEILRGIAVGDGPIDAAVLAIEQVIGRRFELDDFQIQSVTQGKEAVGSALVRLRWGGKLYSGNGISTDIIGAGIRAYLNAVNKIVFGEM